MGAVDGSRALVVVADGHAEIVVGHVDGIRADLALVDALIRLQLAARRLGCSIRLRNPGEELRELLDLVGLADVVASRPGLPNEAEGKVEHGEQLAAEEVVEPGDPAS